MKVKVLCLLALIFGGSLMLSSCKDNENLSDNPNTPDEEVLEKSSERGEALLSILSKAVELDSLPDNWYKNDYTVEPTVGFVKDESTPYVRYVAVSDADEAYTIYKSMVSEDLTGSAKSEQWSMDGIGSLTFNVGNTSDVYATVDVNVNQLPHLTQICFVPASAMGNNSSWFTGDPFYQFGDIVQDKQGSYWICARPANKDAGKSTTHWISFNTLNGNFKEYKKNNCATLVLPDTLGTKAGSEEHIVNIFKLLNELGKAHRNEKVSSSLTLSNVTLHSSDIEIIAKNWDINGYFDNPNVFPGTVLENFAVTLGSKEPEDIHAFYSGHHSGSTPDVHMLTTNVKNFTNVKKEEVKFTWPNKPEYTYNFKKYVDSETQSEDLTKLECKKDNQAMPAKAFVVRYKTGPQLSGKHTLFRNDYEPGKSFSKYCGLKDILVSPQKDDSERIYALGDVVNYSEDDKKEFICVKSASKFYLYNDEVNADALFISYDYYPELSYNNISEEDVKILMFHLLNAYLLYHNYNFPFSNGVSNYIVSLMVMGSNFSRAGKILDKIIVKDNNICKARLCIGNKHYTLSCQDAMYTFTKEDGGPTDEYPQITILQCKDDGKKTIYPITNHAQEIKVNPAAIEAARAFSISNFNKE